MNNQVWYYRADATGRSLVNEREYVSTVDAVKLTSRYAVVLSDGRVTIHPIDAGATSGGERSMMVRVCVPYAQHPPPLLPAAGLRCLV
jgi:hypothetical protein